MPANALPGVTPARGEAEHHYERGNYVMRVVQSALRYYPAVGGVEQHVRQLCEGLSVRGHQVEVVTTDLDQHMLHTRLALPARKTDLGNVSVRRLKAHFLPGLSRYPIVPALPHILLNSHPDLIHAHSYYYCSVDAAAAVSALTRVPMVLNPYYYQPPSLKWRTYQKTLGQLAMRADVVVCISAFEQHLMERAGLRSKRFEIVPPGIDFDEFDASHPSFFTEYGIDAGREAVLLFVGRIAPEKGLHTLIRAFSFVLSEEAATSLVVVGPDGGSRREIESLAEELGCRGKLRFTGPVPRHQLIAAYQQATLFVFPTEYEAFGIVLIEAMAAGLPVLASDTAAVPCVVAHGDTGLLFPVGDAQSMSRQIVTLLRDQSLRGQLSEHAKREVHAKFDSQAQLTKIEKIYESIL